jgi:hypothetical protein
LQYKRTRNSALSPIIGLSLDLEEKLFSLHNVG